MGYGEVMIYNIVCIAIVLLSVVGAATTIICYRRNIHKTVKQLNNMLDTAIEGSFISSIFDESVVSSLEMKMKQFLQSHVESSHQLQADKSKINELISDISHQTKTPISNILLYTQLLHEYQLPEDSLPCIEALSSQASKLNFLIQALVTVSRLETGMIAVVPKQGSIKNLIMLAVKQITPNVNSKQITITLPEEVPQFLQLTANFDLKWTVEAVFNILDNAVKYSEYAGQIVVSVMKYEFFCRIDIRDYGIGIAEAEQSQVFKRFYRSPAVNKQEGVGLGLFLAREIITAEAGYITISSQVGVGSTFSIFLPL